ncbi:MAG: THUMP domain-containing protein [Salinivirgaceae bacterium]|jgi:putative N6-adenine-specific DNA methylase|nr:THUMP domain-containing protein [Salinivirgaceae bacterium]
MKLVSKTFLGLEETLAQELRELGAQNVEILNRAVSFEGDKAMLYRANLALRTALNVLMPIKTFTIESQQDFYDQVRSIDWQQYFRVRKTILVNATTNSTIFDHSHFLELRTKDAVADYFTDVARRRPNVDKENPQVRIDVHLKDKECTISLNSSGQALFKRGYRKHHGEASINEVLAAGIVLQSGWRGENELIDPFCGSGTILTEAALIAANIRPGVYRDQFAFEHWLDFERKVLEEVQEEDEQVKIEVPILGVDISPKQIGFAKANIESAFLQKAISVQVSDFSSIQGEDEQGTIITNPPYDKRVKADEVEKLYRRFGDHLKNEFKDYNAWIISGNPQALKNIGLKTSARITLFNGPIESKLCHYELF